MSKPGSAVRLRVGPPRDLAGRTGTVLKSSRSRSTGDFGRGKVVKEPNDRLEPVGR